MSAQSTLFTGLLRLADDHLILGHRLSEWCGHAPMLEEDLALPNIALDLMGQAQALYEYAGQVEGAGRSADELAFLRLERDYVNLQICERPNGDFGQTVLRQFLFAQFMALYWHATLDSNDNTIAGIAGKAIKETSYHIRHCGEWVIRLGDGTEESARRMAAAMAALAPYCAEMFVADDVVAANAGQLPDPSGLMDDWVAAIKPVLDAAHLGMPAMEPALGGGRQGLHTEHMGFLLAEMQFMQRTYPGLTW